MKAIQVLFDEILLAELDATPDVRDKGRSAVLRQIARDFVHRRRAQEVDAQYERAYARVQAPLGKDFEGWEEEGAWPPE
jgi:metal-responsive CopG/Arc/MetJ family transcriptional regulator